MATMTKEAYQQRLEAHLNEWRGEIERLKREIQQADAEVRTECEPRLNNLSNRHETARQRLVVIQNASGNDWERVRTEVEEALTALTYEYEQMRIWAERHSHEDVLSWAKGMAPRNPKDSIGWAEGQATHESGKTVDWPEGMGRGGEVRGSKGWPEGYDKR